VVTLNTSGGVAGGDTLDSAFAVGLDARATIASQAAERFYRALPGSPASNVQTCITVADGAAAEWLPQETILFDRCAVRRRLHVELAETAAFLGIESLVFGRTAMGEAVKWASLRDAIEVRRNGQLLLHDVTRLEGEVAAALQRSAVADGARAVATLIYVAPDAETRLDPLREALAAFLAPRPLCGRGRRGAPGEGAATPPTSERGVQCGASAWDGMLIARILATDGASLRTAVIAALHVLRDGRALPRVWQC
jgi:urease accessory protein